MTSFKISTGYDTRRMLTEKYFVQFPPLWNHIRVVIISRTCRIMGNKTSSYFTCGESCVGLKPYLQTSCVMNK